MTDLTLLQEYARTRSERAFHDLVALHLDWVYAAARRQVRDPALAEDVTQAVFLTLARRATRLRTDRPLSPWLFRVTRCASITALRADARRRRHEREAAAMRSEAADNLTDDDWEHVAPLLDDAVGRLREKDRRAVLLRFYERHGFAEAGRRMGISEEAARKRTDRAVARLRDMLATRSVRATAAALATGLATRAAEAAPPGLGACVSATASAGINPAAAGLAEGAVRMMRLAKLKTAAVGLGLTLALGALLAMAWAWSDAGDRPRLVPGGPGRTNLRHDELN